MRPDEFTSLASQLDVTVETLALSLAAEFRAVDVEAAERELDRLGGELAGLRLATPREQADALRRCLGERHGFAGDREDYDHPRNSMLDITLDRRRGLPITLSVVYVAVARRAGIPLHGVGLPGHYVVGHFGGDPPILLDPFSGGVDVRVQAPSALVRPWTPQETALRMLSNLAAAYAVRGDLYNAIQAAHLRLALPVDERERRRLERELAALQARIGSAGEASADDG